METIPNVDEFLEMMYEDPDEVAGIYEETMEMLELSWDQYKKISEDKDEVPNKGEYNRAVRMGKQIIKNIDAANALRAKNGRPNPIMVNNSQEEEEEEQEEERPARAAGKKAEKAMEKLEKEREKLTKAMDKKKEALLKKLDKKMEQEAKKLSKSEKCAALGKIAVTVKGVSKCVDRHYKSRVKCRSKKRKGYVFNRESKRCVKSLKKRSALCKKKGLVYDKDAKKCRKSGVKSRAKTAKQWRDQCKSEGKYLVKRKSGYGCRKTAKKSRTLSDRRSACMSKGRTFAKKDDGTWVCRASRKPGRKAAKK